MKIRAKARPSNPDVCERRSTHEKRRVPHLFTTTRTVRDAETKAIIERSIECSWCGLPRPTGRRA